jgi:hypothetical protein
MREVALHHVFSALEPKLGFAAKSKDFKHTKAAEGSINVRGVAVWPASTSKFWGKNPNQGFYAVQKGDALPRFRAEDDPDQKWLVGFCYRAGSSGTHYDRLLQILGSFVQQKNSSSPNLVSRRSCRARSGQ